MEKENTLVRVYTGPEASAILLKSMLEELGIYALTKNDFSGAYLGVAPLSIDLFIRESDLDKAEPVLRDFPEQ